MIEINKNHPKEVSNIVKNETLNKKVDFSRPQKNKKPFSKLSRKKKIIIAIIAVLVLLIISVGVYFLLAKNKPKPAKTITKSQKTEVKKPAVPEKFYSRLSGVEVANKELETAPVFGVMIENSIPARPQSGLNQAEVVFEAIAEGGITRFLALYQQNKPELIGPVRSVRGYYIDWASGFDASIAHVGGSGDALARIRDGKHKDMDEFFNTRTFWRSRNRYAPHNVYTNSANLTALANSKGWNSSNFEGFSRKNDSLASAKNASQIQVNISGFSYNSTYIHRDDCNCYLRSQAGVAHTDLSGGQISPKSIVILKMNNGLASDRYHSIYENLGSGSGLVFQDGLATEIIWSKVNENSPLTLKNKDGTPIKLNRGQTWIVAVGNTTGSVTWQ